MKMKIVEKPLWLRIIIGLVLGIAAGVVLSPGVGLISTEEMQTLAPWVAMPGNLFLALVKMIMMPLVLSSIVLGISSSGDKSFLGRAASRVVPYFVMTTVVAVTIMDRWLSKSEQKAGETEGETGGLSPSAAP